MESSAHSDQDSESEEFMDLPKAPAAAIPKCKFCQKVFSDAKAVVTHEKSCDKFYVIPLKPQKCTTLTTGEDNVVIKCKFCSKQFGFVKNKNRHENECQLNPQARPKFSCKLCGYETNRKDNLLTHEKKVHSNKSIPQPSKPGQQAKIINNTRKKTPCLFPDCDQEFFHKITLIDHLKTCHPDVDVKDPIEKTFNSIKDFHSWKEKEQGSTYSYFAQKSGQSASRIKYFYCQHDGSSHSQRQTSRSNAKGRIKVGHHCIAKLQVWKDEDQKVNVRYFPTHNHVCSPVDFIHQPLPSDVDLYINEKLTWGVSPSKVFKDVMKKSIPRTSTPEQIIQCPASVLSKKRIRERARKMRERRRYDKDEAKALFLMVTQLSKEDNSIILYKPYKSQVKIGPKKLNDEPNSSEIFMLGIQTERQAKLFQEHCHKVVLVDETHGTNHHKYQLLTLMVIDDNRRGWPVAHLITSKSDAETLQYFFQAVKERSPNSVINCVMSDDDSALINSMNMGFSEDLKHLLCKWHLLKAFKKNLRSHVPASMVEQMMTELRVLVNEVDEKLFVQLMDGFIKKYEASPHTQSFINYFNTWYKNRPQKWAMCYRRFPHSNVNTTGHLESFHHRFKKVYLKRKVNRRLDDLVTYLLDVEWDDHLTRIREATLGLAYQPQEIFARHQRGMQIEDEVLQEIEENTWDIKSASKRDKYHIVRYHRNCSFDLCFSKCTQVSCTGLCTHLYSCSCPDNHPLCKHIHKLHSFLSRNTAVQMRDNETLFQPHQNVATDESVYVEEGNDEPGPSFSEINVTSCNESHRAVSRQKQELAENLSYLTDFLSSAEGNPGALAYAVSVSNELVLQLKYMISGNEEEIVPMEPVLKFSSNETLKTQASQIPAFRKPPAKRKNKHGVVSPTKKKGVVKDLLGLLDEDPDNPVPLISNFTPSLSEVSNPCDVLLKCGIEKITLLNLKSLDVTLSPEELRVCKRWDAAFTCGWLSSSIINTYLTKLEEKFPECLALSTDLALRASKGLSNFNILQKTLNGWSEKKVFLFPANPSNIHWVMVVVKIVSDSEVQVRYYDPMQKPMDGEAMKMVLKIIEDMKGIFPTLSGWNKIIYVQAAKQNDSYNCGVHICSFAEQLLRNISYQLLTDSLPFRKLIYQSIVGGCLKHLDHYDEEMCGICGQRFSDDEVSGKSWVLCKACDKLYHQQCVEAKGMVTTNFQCP